MLTMSFTDAQGAAHTDAVVVVQFVNASSNAYANVTRLASGSYESGVSTSRIISYGARFWPSASAMDSGRPPYTMTDKQGNDVFTIESPEIPEDASELVGVAEAHLQSVVIPALLA